MSLTYNTKVAMPSSIKQTCLRSSTNEVIVSYQTTPALRLYNLSTAALDLTSQTLSASPEAIAMAGQASAFCMYQSTGTFQLVELSSGFVANYTGGVALNYVDHNQQADTDPVNNIVLGISNTAGTFNKFSYTTAPYTLTTFSCAYLSFLGSVSSCIFFKGNGRWLVGTIGGTVVEMDSSGNVFNIIRLPYDLLSKQAPAGSDTYPTITNIALWNDILAVVTVSGVIYQYSYSTGDLLYKALCPAGNSTIPKSAFLCTPVSGIVLMGGGECLNTSGGLLPLYEVDMSRVPFKVRDNIWMTGAVSTQHYSSLGINGATGNCWAASTQDNNLWFFSIATRSITTKFVQLQDPPGIPVAGEVLLYNETDADVTCEVSVPVAGINITLPTGKTFMQIGMYASGTDTKVDVSEYIT